MSEFLLSYGLFAAKALTLVLLLLLIIMLVNFIIANRRPAEESIEIQKINEKFEHLQEALESEILPKELLKIKEKQKKKQEKEEAKALKLALKEAEKAGQEPSDPKQKPRLFVLDFEGDMNASEVSSLRECITAILSVASSQDEVLICLESAGGIVHHYGLAASQLERVKRHGVPLTVAVDLIAASGGYLMACVADKILAAPFAVVGSIGVYAQVPNVHRLLEKNNIDIEQHTAGEYKTTLTLLGKNTDKARKKFKEELQDTHNLFKSFVSTYRPSLDMPKLATGEHWYGSQALELGLVDTLVTSDDYLIEKSKDWEIYGVRYVFQETLSSKLSHFLNDFCVKISQTLFKFAQRKTTV